MSFNNGKQNAWNRGGPPQNQQINPNLFANQIGLNHAFQPAVQLNPNINAFVNQAAFNNMSNAALVAAQAQRQLIPPAVGQQRQPSPPANTRHNPNQRTFVGQVTKLCDTYGFIDEDVFFQTSVIKGPVPRVGERVMVSATFNPSMPFKWNAHSIQMLQEMATAPQPQSVQHLGSHATSPLLRQSQQAYPPAGAPSGRWGAPNDRVERGIRDDIRDSRMGSSERHRPARRLSPPSRRDDRRSPRRSPVLRSTTPPRKGNFPMRNRDPLPKREREKNSPSVRERRESREPRRSPLPVKRDADSPPRRRQRIIPRYQCYVPRPIVNDFMSYIDLHKRYPNLYIPSDFVRCEMSWKNSFNLEDPIIFAPNTVEFHVLHKDVDYPMIEGENELPPESTEDADPRYTVKVLLLTHPGAASLRQKVTGLMADGTIDEQCDVQSLYKVLHFIIGIRGKSEVMGIGGQWSPSLDGANPLDPQTLINTAVRTTRAMTGLDLSKCPKWYKMVHLRYNRIERDRLDHVTLLLPDINGTPKLLPSVEEYRVLVEETFPQQLKQKLDAIDAEPFVPQSEAAKKVQAVNDAKAEESTNPETEKANEIVATEPMDTTDKSEVTAEETAATLNDSEKAATEQEEIIDGPTKIPWAQLEEQIKGMKVTELRDQLNARGLSASGLKNALVQRLQEAIDAEKKAEERQDSEEINEQNLIMADETAPSDMINTDDLVAIDEVGTEKMETDEGKTFENTEQSGADEKSTVPTLTREEKDEYKKEMDKFEKSKKDRKNILERHYVFPKHPCVFIYPSKTAKAGKFDCRLASGQSLLDYRLDDSKENSFEVFVFAEALREVLDREFAFNLYHTLHSVLDKEAERKRRDEALTKIETPATEDAEMNPAEGESTENGVTAHGETNETEAKDEKKETTEKVESKDEKDLRLNFTAVVNDVNTFMTFTHFDQNVCGYLVERDLEEIIHSLGFDVSQSSVRRLLKKFSSQNSSTREREQRFNYRNVTDKWIDKDGNVKYTPQLESDAPSRSQLLKGFEETATPTPAKQSSDATPDVTNSGVVFYKGALLNVEQSLEQQKLVEAERAEALLKIQQLDQQLKTTKDQRDHLDKKRKRLEDDVDKYKKRLHEAEKCLKTSQDDTVQMKASYVEVRRYGERLIGLVDKMMPPAKKEDRREKESSTKSDHMTDGKDASSRAKSKEPNGSKVEKDHEFQNQTAPKKTEDQNKTTDSTDESKKTEAAVEEANGITAKSDEVEPMTTE
ncbi:BMA-LST-3, isoform h [Aphelenchoides besseyi]|nr:BMA-LST-3, isoform h [Aphelenchoides besseyi]